MNTSFYPLGAIVLSACAATGTAPSRTEGVAVGTRAPEVAASYVTGDGPKTLTEAKGKVVVVDFWATFCDPCARSFPKYQALLDELGSGLAVLAVSVDPHDEATRAKLIDFGKKQGTTFPLLWDSGEGTRDAYAPRDLPTAYIVDKHGVIRFIHAKYEAGDEETMEAEIRKLLAE